MYYYSPKYSIKNNLRIKRHNLVIHVLKLVGNLTTKKEPLWESHSRRLLLIYSRAIVAIKPQIKSEN